MFESELQSLLFSSFKWCVVRLATYAEHGAISRLIFGSVSVLTEERPRPRTQVGVDLHKLGRQGKVYFRRTVLSTSDALNWYRTVSGSPITPIPSQADEVEENYDGISIATSDLIDDPEWPSLGFPVGADLIGSAGSTDPFLGSGANPSRIHRRFGDSTGFEKIIDDSEAVLFLKRRLHIGLDEYTEYLGSVVLIVPDPILQKVNLFIVPSKDHIPEKVVFRLIPRNRKRLDRLKLTVFERRANLLSRFETIDVPTDGLIALERQLPVQSIGYIVTHPDHGILVHQPSVYPVRTISVSIEPISRKIRVDAPKTESPTSPIGSYKVDEVGAAREVRLGDVQDLSPLPRIIEAEVRRDARAQAQKYDQAWFDYGQREEAMDFIRSRISRAREEVLVADPYFGGRQLMQFMHAIRKTDVSLTILTSRLAFETEPEESPKKRKMSKTRTESMKTVKNSTGENLRLEQFSKALSTFRNRGIQTISVLVLKGKKPPLHDRFLVIDDNVWFLGNSLNALGDRASLILKVPDSEPILHNLREMKSKTQLFERYLKQRSKLSTPTKRKKGIDG
jgi:hypothetical protein